jgi:hypothetical protein
VLVDLVAAVALAALAAFTPLDPPGPAYPGPAWVACLVGAAAGLPLLLRRRWSVPVLVWVVLVAATATLLGVVGAGAVWAIYAPVAVASYTVANLNDRTVTAAAVLVAGLGAAAATVPAFYWLDRPAERGTSGSEVPLAWQIELGMVVVLLGAAWAPGGRCGRGGWPGSSSRVARPGRRWPMNGSGSPANCTTSSGTA